MKLFKKMKDGGAESRVIGYWLVEIKSLFSIVLLHFLDGSRDAYHSHAFHSISWVLKGRLTEYRMYPDARGIYYSERATILSSFGPSLRPVVTTRRNLHKVVSRGDTWVLSFRGPWANTWREFLPAVRKFVTLTHGRKVVE